MITEFRIPVVSHAVLPCVPSFPPSVQSDPPITRLVQELAAEFFVGFLWPALRAEGVSVFKPETVQMVLTVPAYFKHVSSDRQDDRMQIQHVFTFNFLTCNRPVFSASQSSRASLLQAVLLAGFPCGCVRRVVPEPVAAAFTFFMEQHVTHSVPGQDLTVIVCVSDLGGGTYDCTFIRFRLKQIDPSGKSTLFAEVIEVEGDNDLGGSDFTFALACLIVSKLTLAGAVDPPAALDLLAAAETLKTDLCTHQRSVTHRHSDGTEVVITPEDYVRQTKSLTDRMAVLVRKLVGKVRVNPRYKKVLKDPFTLIMVGGGHMDPNLQAVLAGLFAELDITDVRMEPPRDILFATTAIARGAATIAGLSSNSAIILALDDTVPRRVCIRIGSHEGSHAGDADQKTSSCTLVKEGAALDVWHDAPTGFRNERFIKLQCGDRTPLLTFNIAEGPYKSFNRNNFVGTGELLYGDIRQHLGDLQVLEEGELTFHIRSCVRREGTVDIRIRVMHNSQEIVEVPIDFHTAGCIPRPEFEQLLERSRERLSEDSFRRTLRDVDEAVADLGQALPGRLGSWLESVRPGEDKDFDADILRDILVRIGMVKRAEPWESDDDDDADINEDNDVDVDFSYDALLQVGDIADMGVSESDGEDGELEYETESVERPVKRARAVESLVEG